MDLSLREAAELMGLSVRQLRYMVQKGTVAARKEGGRWVVPKETVTLTAGQQRAVAQKSARAADVVDKLLEKKKGKHYSMLDLRAFEAGRSLYREAKESFGEEHAVPCLLFEALMQLGCGCHAFSRNRKVAAFVMAREQVSRAAVHLFTDDGEHEDLGRRLETELIPRISGLIRRVESRK